MIRINDKDIGFIAFGQKAVTAVYSGAKLVWEAIRSCFGRGSWANDYPWKNDDAWKN